MWAAVWLCCAVRGLVVDDECDAGLVSAGAVFFVEERLAWTFLASTDRRRDSLLRDPPS